MAKKKESIYKTWNEIDAALKSLGELAVKKGKLEGELTIKINKLKETHSLEVISIANEAKKITTEITRFCEQNKDGFLKSRNKKFNFGKVSYRVTEKVSVKDEAAAIKALECLNMDFALRIKKELDIDKVKELSPSILAQVGIQILKDDKLKIEPDIVKIAANIQTSDIQEIDK